MDNNPKGERIMKVRKGTVTAVIIACFWLITTPCRGDKGATYVGSAKCKRCHEELYRGWRTTMHPYKFQRATEETVIGDFSKNNRIDINGKPTVMSIKNGLFFITTIGPDGKEHTYKVDYVIGEFWKQLYVTEFPDGSLRILPVMWIVETQRWTIKGKGTSWSKTIYQYACSGCHNTGTQVNFQKASGRFNTKWADLGVGCEACHGPGSKHLTADDAHKSSTIINPAKIPDPRRAVMVCGACHNRGTSTDGKYGYPQGYKPGKILSFNEKPKLFPNGCSKANRQQYVDWKKSGHAKAGVACWDCHYVHRKGEANRYQTKLPGSLLCRSCHTVESKGVHGIHSVNNCVGCHMPPIGKRAVQGDVHSHQFRVISPKESIEAGGIKKQPNSCNACHHHKTDSPKELLKILEKVKAEGKTRQNHY